MSRANCFPKATLAALELTVLDPFLPRPERVAAGKLRLCVQASMRYDDLLNTPLSCCEWVRRQGEERIVGLRARALRGKSGPRPWVAGVEADHDEWLTALMDLILQCHGDTWLEDDHFGKLAAKDEVTFLRAPSGMETDVALVKKALARLRAEEGVEPRPGGGLSKVEISTLRWHGAKATMSSIMQHLGIKEKAVRFQGNWRDRQESMPDTYLREAQTLVLRAQERCLSYLRDGGDIVRLVGAPLVSGNTEEEESLDSGRRERAMAATFDGAPVRKVPPAFLDDAFDLQGKFRASQRCQSRRRWMLLTWMTWWETLKQRKPPCRVEKMLKSCRMNPAPRRTKSTSTRRTPKV